MQKNNLKTSFLAVLASYKDTLKFGKKNLAENKTLIALFVVIASLSSIFYSISLYFGGIVQVLSTSSRTPWGIVTSIFIHGGGLNHLSSNLAGLFTMFALYSLTEPNSQTIDKPRRVKWFIGLIFGSAILSNILFLILRPDSISSGLSGVVFAAQGVAFAQCLLNTFTFPKYKRPITADQKRSLTRWMVNVVVFSVIIANIAISPNVFLGVAQGVNVFVHGISFLVSFTYPLITNLQWRSVIQELNLRIRR
jgi:hypothetical protein